LNVRDCNSALHSASVEYPILGYRWQAPYHRGVSKTSFTQANDVFRELLKEARAAKNLTQADVAKRLGAPQSYVSKYESGERRLDFVETTKVCEALSMCIEDFAAAYSAKLTKARRSKGA
jgi:ribosome-binding protein aMBF1 (putative translation factor)